MKVLLYSTCIAFHVVSILAACPGGFNHCGVESSRSCEINPDATEGWLSYGANGRYSFIAFSKPSGTPMSIECDNDHGDIIFGVQKHCCYKATTTGMPHSGWQGHAAEGSAQQFWNNYDIERYGANSRYVYRVLSHSAGYCNNDFFNDPYLGTVKHCNWYPNLNWNWINWVYCGNEGADCVDLAGGSQFQWVRYGEHVNFYYRLVSANDGKIPCNNDFFDDPEPGLDKKCWRQNPPMNMELPLQPYELSGPSEIDTPRSYIPPAEITSIKWYYLMSYVINNPSWVFVFGCLFITLIIIG